MFNTFIYSIIPRPGLLRQPDVPVVRQRSFVGCILRSCCRYRTVDLASEVDYRYLCVDQISHLLPQ